MLYREKANAPVSNLQQALRVIGQYGGTESLLVPDGEYGAETERAVRQFQSDNGLEVNGRVGLADWNAIFLSYLTLDRQSDNAKPFFPDGGTVQAGERSDRVYFLQVMLNAAARVFTNLVFMEVTGYYGQDCSEAVELLRVKFGLPAGGGCDIAFYSLLISLYESLEHIP